MAARLPALDAALERKITDLQDEGFEIWRRFDEDVRRQNWHPFVPVEYNEALTMLLSVRAPNLRFLEWGCGTGVITIMADLLGFEAYGIEIDGGLVDIARELARKYESKATFAEGSFLPAGYEWRARDGDNRMGTIGIARSAYLELGLPLEEFDIVYGYPWDGEAQIFRDVMDKYGRADAVLLMP
jgi:SAM-dependent methyltransferase